VFHCETEGTHVNIGKFLPRHPANAKIWLGILKWFRGFFLLHQLLKKYPRGFSRPGIIQGQCLRRKKERCRKSAFLSVAGTFYCGGGGGNSNMFLMFIPKIGEMIQFFEHIFSNGLVQPPTRMVFSWVVMWKTERLCDSQLDFTLPPEIEGIDTF